MYALLFVAGLFLAPAFIVGAWAWAIEKITYEYRITDRGFAVLFSVLLLVLAAVVAAYTLLPTP